MKREFRFRSGDGPYPEYGPPRNEGTLPEDGMTGNRFVLTSVFGRRIMKMFDSQPNIIKSAGKGSGPLILPATFVVRRVVPPPAPFSGRDNSHHDDSFSGMRGKGFLFVFIHLIRTYPAWSPVAG
jgi:hypothetical protein